MNDNITFDKLYPCWNIVWGKLKHNYTSYKMNYKIFNYADMKLLAFINWQIIWKYQFFGTSVSTTKWVKGWNYEANYFIQEYDSWSSFSGKTKPFSRLLFFKKLISTSLSLTTSTMQTKCKIFFLVGNITTT